ncbi:MAG: hypothetical protein R3E86_10670 [Pseudomonadales bacterium]
MRLWGAETGDLKYWWTLSGPYVVEQKLAPGSYRMTLSSSVLELARPWQPKAAADAELSFECRAGQVQFVRHAVDTDYWSGRTEHRLELPERDAAIAELGDYVRVTQPSERGWLSRPAESGPGEKQ